MRLTSLYNIEKLHQTTTTYNKDLQDTVLYNIEKLHQTTTPVRQTLPLPRCIILKNYIKPQQELENYVFETVV